MTNYTAQGRTLVMGDLHGAYLALVQCLERCGFRKDLDTLITLGDICDGWPYVYECLELLRGLNTINMIGNHDQWFSKWLTTMQHGDLWSQGGKGTAQSYLRAAGKDEHEYNSWATYDYNGRQRTAYEFVLDPMDVPPGHWNFFLQQQLYYKDDKNRLFVHAGFDRALTLRENQRIDPSVFCWDRDLWRHAKTVHSGQSLNFAEDLSEIFIGHTQTTTWTADEIITDAGIIIPKGAPITAPMHADIIYNLDTGAGSNGKLTIMDVDTHEYWQSDSVKEFYGEYKPR